MASILSRQEIARELDIHNLMSHGQTLAGLSDYGDLQFTIALKKLLACAIEEVNFHAAGLQGFRDEVLRDLINRLRFQDDLKRHPEILEEDVSDPIFLIGLPRSGTTKTQRMIGADPNLLNTHMWQLLNPAPFPNAVAGQPDPRIAAAGQGDPLLSQDNPDVDAAHHMAADSLEEFWNISEFTFNDWYQNCRTPLPSFSQWLTERSEPSDLDKYQYMHRLLQYLQWQQGGRNNRRWLLKGCGHLTHMDALVEMFPDATLVHIHRHPRSCVPSLAKLLLDVWSLRVDNISPEFVGQHILAWEKMSLARYLQARDQLQLNERIFDVQYEQIRNDPMSVIREIYRRANFTLTAEAEQAMSEWHNSNEQFKHGKHSYSLAQFGLSESQIDDSFADYIARFIQG